MNLAKRLEKTPKPSIIVFVLEGEKETGKIKVLLVELFQHFTRPSDLEVALGSEAAPGVMDEAVAKLVATRNRMTHKGREPDPLGRIKGIIASTQDLRSPSGRLSAVQIAKTFGLSVAELSRLVGSRRQAVSKTPDSDSLQRSLRPFERVARLRTALREDDFRNWLHLANDQLGNRTPFELIREGRVSVIADLVEDILTGSPT